jgi:hypothetical protein
VAVPVSKTPDPSILRRLDTHGAACAIAAPVWHELTSGCRRLPKGARRAALDAYLREVVRPSFPILPYDEAAATCMVRSARAHSSVLVSGGRRSCGCPSTLRLLGVSRTTASLAEHPLR